MKHLSLIILLGIWVLSCEPRAKHAQDNNPAEGVATEGEKDKDNAETNKEALADSRDPNDTARQMTNDQTEMGNDQTFAKKAAEAGLTEVKLGELAGRKASSSSVKDFAAMMVKDHNKGNEELKKLATQKQIDLPEGLCQECLRKYNELSSLSGQAFDRKYMEMMVADHRDAVEKFEQEANQGKDQQIKSWASQKLPTLKHHLTEAETISKNSGITKR
jgi:putative membrane protein